MSWIKSLLSLFEKNSNAPRAIPPSLSEAKEQHAARLAGRLADMAAGYRLQHPSSYYLAHFRSQDIQVAPHRPKGHYLLRSGHEPIPADPSARPQFVRFLPERREHGWIVVSPDAADQFTVRIPSAGGKITEKQIDLVKRILQHIVEMDAAARQLTQTDEYEEHLESVEVDSDKVQFHYVAGACNTEWWINFDIKPDGSFGPPK
jgi:hypothetical protein